MCFDQAAHDAAIPTLEELRAMSEDAPKPLNPKARAATRDGKAPLDLLEREANEQIARALQTGAKKYGKMNYKTIPIFATTYGAAIRRHIDAWLDQEDEDPESGLNHLAHIGANVHVLLDVMRHGDFRDDRGPQPRTEEQERLSSASNAQHSAQRAQGADPGPRVVKRAVVGPAVPGFEHRFTQGRDRT